MTKINGIAVAAIGAGSLFIWSGIKGWSITGTLGDIVTGKRPNQSSAYPLSTGENAGSSSSGGNTGNALADSMLSHLGHLYKYGGAPGKDGSKPWDCSSCVNWNASSIGLAIPGYGAGKYDGSVHGPPTGLWAVWPGIQTVHKGQIIAGDIIIWPTHMGVAISPTEMVSATGPDGTPSTKKDPIHGGGPVGESIIRIGRY
jgi:hypothetical protein